ncbi:MAG TPA: hypothetical protein DDX92_09320 [Flavobacteriales bacterium]|jgi:hypothetical protein|nr:hypothetical protein [Flavobacteriales bacterium]
MDENLYSFYSGLSEPMQGCFLALEKIILDFDERFHEAYKYSVPFFMIGDKNICYLWQHKNKKLAYIGFVDGGKIANPVLEKGNRKRMKIFTINPERDIPVDTIHDLLAEAVQLVEAR